LSRCWKPEIISSTHTTPVPNSTNISSGLAGAALLMPCIALIACDGLSLRIPPMTSVEKARYTPADSPAPTAAVMASVRV
jgi:hypothetical protein